MEIKQFIDLYQPCRDAQRFLVTQDSLSEAWHNCERLDWLTWAVVQFPELHNGLQLYRCAVVRQTPLHDGRTVWDLLTDKRSKNAVEVSERYARGEATLKELHTAANAAAAAAAAANAAAAAVAAANAAAAAAYAAAYAADAVAAANAAAAAAYADAANAAAAAYAADARTKARKFQLSLFNDMFSFDEINAQLEKQLAQVD